VLEFTEAELRLTAERLLDLTPDPIPRYRLLRDVLNPPWNDPVLQEARTGLDQSRWVELLSSSQHADGTWGRFHTRDTRVKQPFPTTELAVAIALGCGLDRASAIMKRLMPTLLDYVEGKYIWSDRPEKHDNPAAWAIWVRHYSAALLSTIDRCHPLLKEFRRIWEESTAAAFEGGVYDRNKEIEALNRLLHCEMKSPVPFHVKPSLQLLSATKNRLPADLERRVLDYMFRSPVGIYYVTRHELGDFPALHDRRFWAWTRAYALLSRFGLWREFAEEGLNWVWSLRNDEGFWTPGEQVPRRPYAAFPLSESWRRRENRTTDFSVEMLSLLSRAFKDPVVTLP
jgi:hypothetical protein